MTGDTSLLLDAVVCGAIVTVGEHGQGSDRVDVPLPWALIFPDTPYNVAPIVARAAVATECYTDLQPLMDPLRHAIAQSPAVFRADVARLIGNDVHVMAVVCNSATTPSPSPSLDRANAGAQALIASVLSVLPYATVELFVDAPPEEWVRANAPFLAILDVHFQRHSVGVRQRQRRGPDDECEPGDVLFASPHAVATGRALLFATTGQVVVAADIAGRAYPNAVVESGDGTQAAGGAGNSGGGRAAGTPWVAADGRVFMIAQRTAGSGDCALVGDDGVTGGFSPQRCNPVLIDPDNVAGMRIDALYDDGGLRTGGGGNPAVHGGDVEFLCRQPLWLSFANTLPPGSEFDVCRGAPPTRVPPSAGRTV